MIIAPGDLRYMPFQEEGIEWLIDHPRALLADQMGTGKTIQVAGLINAVDPATVLVICPASAKDHWKRELEKWLLLCPSLGIIYGGDRPKAKIIIVNYDLLHRHTKALRSRYWDLIVIDEGHYVKEIKSRRTKQVVGSRTTPPLRGRRVVVLTGTPVINRPIELYPILRYLDGPAWPSYDEYGERYCGGRGGVIISHFGSTRLWQKWNTWCDYHGLKRGPVIDDGSDWDRFSEHYNTSKVKLTRLGDYVGASNLPELRDRLTSIMLRRTKQEVFPDLAPKVRRVWEVDPDTGRWHLSPHEGFRTNMLQLERAEYLDGDELSTMRRETAERNLGVKHKFMLDALKESGKIVVFVHHKESVATLRQLFGSMAVTICGATPNKQRQKIVDQFQSDPSKRVFIGTKAAAEIYTLTAASRVIIAEPFWVPGVVEQMEDRLHRYSQTKEVIVDHLAQANSLDVVMAHTIVAKQQIIDQLMN